MFKTLIILIFLIVNVNTRFIPDNFLGSKHDNNTHMVEETQHATCSISSEDIAASANATITRQLKGVCTSAHMDNRLDILEKIIIRELNDIKELLLYPEDDKNGNSMQKSNHLSYKNLEYENEIISSPIENEIIKNNMTATKDDTGIIFNYYWKINNIANILNTNTYIDSGDFYFSGYHLFVRFHSRNRNVFIQIIGIGDFKLSHQFGLLNQHQTNLDVYSPIIINCNDKLNKINVQCEAFKLSQDTLLTKNLIKNNILIIKLMIYL